MNKEKLVELLRQCVTQNMTTDPDIWGGIVDVNYGGMADHLIANGVIVLPCKVGDTVYEAQQIRKRVQPLEIISVNIGRMGGVFFNWELKDGIGIYYNAKGFGASQLGKTVFLTREEAEAALKEGQ